jgi:hypothetical protein
MDCDRSVNDMRLYLCAPYKALSLHLLRHTQETPENVMHDVSSAGIGLEHLNASQFTSTVQSRVYGSDIRL